MAKLLLFVPVAIAVLYGAHRFALWMESRGWLYYKTSGSGASSALMNIHQLISPTKEYVLNERAKQQDRIEYSVSGAPPDVDGDATAEQDAAAAPDPPTSR